MQGATRAAARNSPLRSAAKQGKLIGHIPAVPELSAMTLRFITAIALAALAVPLAAQPADPIAARQAIMKQNGRDTGAGAKMLKGEVPYDPASAMVIFKNMNDSVKKFGALFPKGSETGGDTEAAPAVWTKPAEFKAALMKFEADTKAAMAAKPATLDAFKAQFITVTGNCKSCHEGFRIKKN
jgi:cytochrome c556